MAKKLFVFLLCSMLVGLSLVPGRTEARTAKLQNKKVTIMKGQSRRVKLKYNRKKVSWTVLSGKKYIRLKKKSRTGVTIVGKKKGRAVVRAKVGKRKFTCKVTVRGEIKKPLPSLSPKETEKPGNDNVPVQTLAPTETERPDTAESDSPSATPTPGDILENDKTIPGKILIAYFSMVEDVPENADAVTHATPIIGNTESAALEIQKAVGGDLFAIKTVKKYPASHSQCSQIASEELNNGIRPELSTHVNNISDYNIVFLGFPIWVYREPMAICTFLEEYDFSGKTIIPFCTSMAVGIETSVEDIQNLCPGVEVLAGLRLATEQEDYSEQVSDWVRELNICGDNGKNTTSIILETENSSLNGYLYDSVPASSLLDQLPLTVTLNDSDNDFCGGSLNLEYSNADIKTGYKNGDLAFWTPGKNFVIFVDDEEKSASTGNLVILGRLTESQQVLDSLKGTLTITIKKADSP